MIKKTTEQQLKTLEKKYNKIIEFITGGKND